MTRSEKGVSIRSHPSLARQEYAGLQVADKRGHIEKGGQRGVALGDVGDCLGGKGMNQEKQTSEEARPEKFITEGWQRG